MRTFIRFQRRASKGFTLIELLVVITILAILFSIIGVAAMRAKHSANIAVCASNQRQISAGTKAYLADHKGIYMDHRYKLGTNPSYAPNRSPAEHTWFDALYPYLGNRIYQCPDYADFTLNAHDIGIGQNSFFLGQMDHRDGETGGTRIASTKDFPYVAIKSPSKCIEYADSEKKHGSHWSLTLWWPYINRAQEGISSDPSRHKGAGVVVFADSHVEIFKNPDSEINPRRDNTAEFIEYWDPRQRADLFP